MQILTNRTKGQLLKEMNDFEGKQPMSVFTEDCQALIRDLIGLNFVYLGKNCWIEKDGDRVLLRKLAIKKCEKNRLIDDYYYFYKDIGI